MQNQWRMNILRTGCEHLEDCSFFHLLLFRLIFIRVLVCVCVYLSGNDDLAVAVQLLRMMSRLLDCVIAGLHPPSPRHLARRPSALVSRSIRSSYLSHMIASTTSSDQYWHFHRSGSRNTLIYAHTTSRTLPAFVTSAETRQSYLRLKLENLWSLSCYTSVPSSKDSDGTFL